MKEPPKADWDFEAIVGGWAKWVASLTPELSSKLARLRPCPSSEPGVLAVEPKPPYTNHVIDGCEAAEFRGKIEAGLGKWLGRPVSLRFLRQVDVQGTPRPRHPAEVARTDGLEDDPIVKSLVEKFEARLVRVDLDEDSAPAES